VMSLGLGSLSLYAQPELRRVRLRPKAVVRDLALGLGSAGALYVIFQVGDRLARMVLPGGGSDIAAIYALNTLRPRKEIASRLATIIGPAEELFWRGLVTPRLQASLPVLSGPGLAWIMYSAANAASGELPIVMGALVGGALWGALAVLTEGVLAPILCHAAWTGLMLLAPPGAVREKMTP